MTFGVKHLKLWERGAEGGGEGAKTWSGSSAAFGKLEMTTPVSAVFLPPPAGAEAGAGPGPEAMMTYTCC